MRIQLKAPHSAASNSPSVEVSSCIVPTTSLDFSKSLSTISMPNNYDEGKQNSDWVAAQNEEMIALKHNDTWILTELPPERELLASGRSTQLNTNQTEVWTY